MTTLSTLSAPVAQAPEAPARRRSTSPATNLSAWSSPLVTAEQRKAIDAELIDLGAKALRGTHATETVARKAIRVALREAGYEAADAREMAVEVIRDSRA